MKIERVSAVAVATALVIASIGVGAWVLRPAPSRAAVDPSDFSNPVANPYFPLTPGAVFHYRGSEDRVHFRELLTITHHTKAILGVTTTAVFDVLRRADGSLAENTVDWYADDNAGNVWYFGERTATYDRQGNVKSRDGSWEAGVNGAVAGTIMPANPHPTDAYRQEFLRGHAEDQAWIVRKGFQVKTPFGTVKQVLKSFEWTELEPAVMSIKLYAPGLGIVEEHDMTGGTERFELVGVSHA